MDSRYVGDNHKPKSSQNGLVTKRENESEGDPLEEGRRLVLCLRPYMCTYVYICVCVLREKKREEKKRKKRKKKKRKERKKKEKKKEKEKEKGKEKEERKIRKIGLV